MDKNNDAWTLERLVLEINKNKITDFTVSRKEYEILSDSVKSIGIWHINNDARSAAFYAYGMSQEKGSPAVLIVREDELASCYTGFTEAMLQHVAFIVICIQNSLKGHRFIEKCISNEFPLNCGQSQYDLDKILSGINDFHSPVMFDISEQPSNTELKECSLAFLKNSALKSFNSVICFDRYKDLTVDNTRLYSCEHRYGVFSKYLGFIKGTEDKACLIAPAEFFDLDINILNSRYINGRFKVILINKNGGSFKYKNWVNNNSIGYAELSEDNINELNNYLNNDLPEIIFLSLKEN